MEALVAFSIACNVVQVLDFSLKIFRECKQLADSGSTARLDEFNLVSKQLEGLCQGLDRSLASAPKPLGKNDDDLLELAKSCAQAAHDVQARLDEIMMNKKEPRGKFDKMRKMVTSSRSVTAVYNKLREYERLLSTQILVQLSRRQEDIHLLQQSRSEQVDLQLRAFLTHLSQGVTEISALVTNCHEEAKDLLVTQHVAVQRSLARQTTTLNRSIANEHTISRQLIRDDISATHTLLQSTAHDLQKASVTAQSRESLLASLYYPEIWHRQEQIASVHAKTYEWIFQEDENHSRPWHCLTKWLKSQGPNYWVSGKPGSGKSTLMKFINGDERTRQFLRQWCATEPLVLSFFFWKAGSPLQRSAQGMLRSLLYQLFRLNHGVADELLRRDIELGLRTPNSVWSELSLKHLLDMTLGLLSSKALFVLVDGLDEMQEEDGGFDLKTLLIYLNDISSRINIKICFSSRPGNPMSSIFADIPQLRLEDLTKIDMHHYVQDLLMAHSEVRHVERWKLEELAARLTFRAAGVFLWVVLATKSLLRGLENHDTMKELEDRLAKLPSGLENLYVTMWSSLGEDERLYRREAANLLKFALLHQENSVCWPLSLFGLVVALEPDLVGTVFTTGKLLSLRRVVMACERMKKRLSVICAGLLEVGPLRGAKWPVDTSDQTDCINATDISSPCLLRRDADVSEEQDADWQMLYFMHNETSVNFVHRSAIDFLSDTVTGQQILYHADLTDLEVCTRLLKGDFAAYAMRLSSLDLSGLMIHIDFVHNMFTTRLHQTVDNEPQGRDILQVLHDYTVQAIALQDTRAIITKGDWLIDRSDPLMQYRGFLGFVMSVPTPFPGVGQRSPFVDSRWAFNRMKESDQSYKNYLLACAVGGSGKSVEILLQHGADPRSSSKLGINAPAAESSWSIALRMFLENHDELVEAESQTRDILTAFLNHQADLDEAVVQEIELFEFSESRCWQCEGHVDMNRAQLQMNLKTPVTFLRGIKAVDVVDFLQKAGNAANAEGKGSARFHKLLCHGSLVGALPWRYVAHDCEVGFRLVGEWPRYKKVLCKAWHVVQADQIPIDHHFYEKCDALSAALIELSKPISGENLLKYLHFRPEQTPDFQQELLVSFEERAQAYKRQRWDAGMRESAPAREATT